MPLVIPAGRNLTEEGFISVLTGLQVNRIQEERRRRQEEAADAGGGPLGAAIGTGVGLALAIPTGGLSLVAGAALGGGIGQIAGTLIDEPGSAVPGGQMGQINQGLNRVTRGLLIQASADKTEDEKQEAFVADLVADFGPEAATQWRTFQTESQDRAKVAGQPVPKPSDLRTAFIGSRARQLREAGERFAGGRKLAAQVVAQERQRIDAFRDIKTTEQLFQAFNVGPHDLETFGALQTQEHIIDESERLGQADPRQVAIARRTVAAQKDDFARRLRRKPPPSISLQELQKSGAPAQIGTLYTDGPPETAITAHSWTGRGWNSLPYGGGKNQVRESETLPGTFFHVDDDGNRTFHSRRLPDGRIVGVGDPWEHPALGWVQHDRNGELDTIKGVGEDDTDKLFDDIATKGITQGGMSGADAAQAATEVIEEREKAREIRAAAKLTRQLEDAKSADEVVKLLASQSQALEGAMKVMREPHRFARETVTVSVRQILLSLRELRQTETNLSPVVWEDLARLAETAIDIGREQLAPGLRVQP